MRWLRDEGKDRRNVKLAERGWPSSQGGGRPQKALRTKVKKLPMEETTKNGEGRGTLGEIAKEFLRLGFIATAGLRPTLP
jgi:hypothetical protein